MIRLEQVGWSFGRRCLLESVSMEVRAGDLIVLRGPSGCGKTTLLHLLAGLIEPDRGHRVADTRHIGLAFQDDRLIPWLTVEENLRFIEPADRPFGHLETGLERMGLAEARYAHPDILSGGMRKRLNILRALISRPDVLLLDEPYAFQDEEYIERINEDLQTARERGAAVVIVSHERIAVVPESTRVIQLDQPPVRIV